jgi:hypothetical protein
VKPIAADELWSLPEYERIRREFRREIIALKEHRRVDVGKLVTLLFMNRELVRSQIMEMIRIERITNADDVQHELATYNGLLPQPGGLSATIFIAAEAGVSDIRPTLDRLVGLNEHVSLRLGSEVIRGRFDPAQFEEDRISAVQYVQFDLSPAHRSFLRAAEPELFAVIDHPNYSHRAWVSDEVRASLACDLDAE